MISAALRILLLLARLAIFILPLAAFATRLPLTWLSLRILARPALLLLLRLPPIVLTFFWHQYSPADYR